MDLTLDLFWHAKCFFLPKPLSQLVRTWHCKMFAAWSSSADSKKVPINRTGKLQYVEIWYKFEAEMALDFYNMTNSWPRFGTALNLAGNSEHQNLQKIAKALQFVFEVELTPQLQALDRPRVFVPETMSQSDFIANDDGNATWQCNWNRNEAASLCATLNCKKNNRTG